MQEEAGAVKHSSPLVSREFLVCVGVCVVFDLFPLWVSLSVVPLSGGGDHVYAARSLSCHRGSHASAIAMATSRGTEPRLDVTLKHSLLSVSDMLSADGRAEVHPENFTFKSISGYIITF